MLIISTNSCITQKNVIAPPPNMAIDLLYMIPDTGGYEITFSSDSEKIAISLWNTNVWQVMNGEEECSLGKGRNDGDTVFLPNENTLVVARPFSHLIEVWNISDCSLIESMRFPSDFPFHKGIQVEKLSISPDGESVAFSTMYNGIQVRKLFDWDLVFEFDNSGESIEQLSFTPNSEILVTGSLNGSIMLWQMKDGQQVGEINNGEPIRNMVITPDGKNIITGTNTDNKVRIWRISTGELVNEFTPYSEENKNLWSLAVSPNGEIIATGAEFGQLAFWQLDGNEQLYYETIDSSVMRISFSPDGSILAATDINGNLYLWRVNYSQNSSK
jgi:WD40 repeat protein